MLGPNPRVHSLAFRSLASLPRFASSLTSNRIPEDKLKAAFPVPWGFLFGWWLWGISYLFPLNGSVNVNPTAYGIAACVICFFVSFIASVPMSDAVQNRIPKKKMMLSLMFLLGWIALGVLSSLDATAQTAEAEPYVWVLCMLGPITIIYSQKILFGARKMGTLWELSGKPNFHPIVYNMGGPLFVWGWFMLWLGTCGLPGVASPNNIYGPPSAVGVNNTKATATAAAAAAAAVANATSGAASVATAVALVGKVVNGTVAAGAFTNTWFVPLFLNVRTLVAFFGGCGMVPVVRWLDYSHDEDGPWCGENKEGKVFGKWWLGTDGTYFGLFLESPWPFVIMWTVYGFSAFLTFDNQLGVQTNGVREALLCLNCVLQGVDAGILIQANLYAGNMAGKSKFSKPFVLLFVSLAINIGYSAGWFGLTLSLPGAILVILGQKTVFGHRKRGDYTMQNAGKANPYDNVNVYSWGEVFFMIGWILICWAMSLPL